VERSTSEQDRLRVFVGVQRLRSPSQQRVVDAVRACLTAQGLVPVLRPHDPDAMTLDPLPAIAQSIRGCDAAVIVAFLRMRIGKGEEFPESEFARQVRDRAISAVWDHIEAAMAYQAGLPLLVLQEHGLYQYGIVHTGRTSVSFSEFSLASGGDGLHAVLREAIGQWCAALCASCEQ
jgi:hypothetical protein